MVPLKNIFEIFYVPSWNNITSNISLIMFRWSDIEFKESSEFGLLYCLVATVARLEATQKRVQTQF